MFVGQCISLHMHASDYETVPLLVQFYIVWAYTDVYSGFPVVLAYVCNISSFLPVYFLRFCLIVFRPIYVLICMVTSVLQRARHSFSPFNIKTCTFVLLYNNVH